MFNIGDYIRVMHRQNTMDPDRVVGEIVGRIVRGDVMMRGSWVVEFNPEGFYGQNHVLHSANNQFPDNKYYFVEERNMRWATVQEVDNFRQGRVPVRGVLDLRNQWQQAAQLPDRLERVLRVFEEGQFPPVEEGVRALPRDEFPVEHIKPRALKKPVIHKIKTKEE